MRRKTDGTRRTLQGPHYNVSVRLEMDSDLARHILQRRGPGGLKHISGAAKRDRRKGDDTKMWLENEKKQCVYGFSLFSQELCQRAA